MLRIVRHVIQDPVFRLFKVLGRRHRLLHLLDLFDTNRIYKTIDQREIRRTIHKVFVIEKKIAPWCLL